MGDGSIRSAYTSWTEYQRRVRSVVAGLTEAQLALRAGPDRWPLWAILGHAACQRVFWLCVFAGEPGESSTPFPDSGHLCPGDEDLAHALDAAALVAALDSTFAIVERCLDTWTPAMLDEVIRRDDFGPDWTHTRGWVIGRVFAHDIHHWAEANAVLAAAGLDPIDLWAGD